MAYKHIMNFWSIVPAVDIQAIYDIIKSSDSNSIESDPDFMKSKRSMNDSDIGIIKSIDVKNKKVGDKDNDIEIIESNDFKRITIPDISFKDYQSKYSTHSVSAPVKKNMNILIIGDCVGGVMKCIARMYRHKTDNLNIYIVSMFAESVVRNLLFLSLLHEPSSNMGILEKAETFLEIFGNTFVRASTSTFVENKSSNILVDIVSQKQPLTSVPSISLEFLKQREIDEICKVLGFLKNSGDSYDIGKAWENSLRAYFGTRYDGRKNLFDYYYNMKLFHYPIISLGKYLDWCETGIAFKLRKALYTIPNKTLCVRSVGTKSQSSDLYYGDITISPYITFGVECGDKTFFKKVNMQYSHTSEAISKFNIIDFMTEFTSKSSKEKESKNLNVYQSFYPTFLKTSGFRNFFDVAYVTCDMTAYMTRDLTNDGEIHLLSKVLKKDSVVTFETMKNVINSTEEQKIQFCDIIDRLARTNDLKSICTFSNGCFEAFTTNETFEI